jgi:hypothetical protein
MPVKTKTITITPGEQRVLVAIFDALQMGNDPVAAGQRAQELNHDVEPVADGSEEQTEIWNSIYDLFTKIRMA